MDNSTIAAIATPHGSGGIGIIKISGNLAIEIAERIFKKAYSPINPDHQKRPGLQKDINIMNTANKSNKSGTPDIDTHKLQYGHIINPENGKIIDEVLLAVMKAPHSYTCEDIVEIQAHSGHIGLKQIMEQVINHGARPAEPGEFTKRAFINGRIDLTQAEAVIDMINARTETALKIAASQIDGEIKNLIKDIKQNIFDSIVKMEAIIDFPDDIEYIIEKEKEIGFLDTKIKTPINELIRQYKESHVYREGINVVIVGRPNVGKSSLMNQVLNRDRAIVTPHPGTTRDMIEEHIIINEIPVMITDTAGLHETDNPIEKLGIKKTQITIEKADLILFMVDAKSGVTREDQNIYRTIDHEKAILVLNKIDLISQMDKEQKEIPQEWEKIEAVRISALYNTGIKKLKAQISKKIVGDHRLNNNSFIIPNIRQKKLLERASGLIENAITGLKNEDHFDLIVIDLKEANEQLCEVLGISKDKDVIDQIFKQFCIGK